jgi:hypothetical protein
MRRSVTLALLLLLGACRATSYVGNEDSPYYPVPAGSKLTLHSEIAIPANQAGVFLQGGQILPFSQVNPYHPHCKFELRRPRASPQPVAPDEFTITRTVQEITHSVRADYRHLARRDDGGSSVRTYATRMDLRSEKQPDVFRLTCGQWEYPPFERHVTINEIRKALGNLISLKLAK